MVVVVVVVVVQVGVCCYGGVHVARDTVDVVGLLLLLLFWPTLSIRRMGGTSIKQGLRAGTQMADAPCPAHSGWFNASASQFFQS